jgi:putative ABC transport system permease protein
VSRIAEWIRRAWLLLHRDRASRELEAEMRLHREFRAAELRTQGLSAADARRAAARRFGNATTAVESSRDQWGFGSLDDFVQDVRYALRRLRQRPGFTFAVVGVLALGIGATTAMFSAIDAAMLKPLPFERPNELLTLHRLGIPGGGVRTEATFDFTTAAAMHDLFANVAAYASGGLNLSEPDRARRVNAGVVTANFFETLGVMPGEGRAFSEDEGKPGAADVTLISWDLWQDYYGGRSMLGVSIPLGGKPFQVIGVMPRGFSFPTDSDLWIPLSVPTTTATFAAFRGLLPLSVVARVAPGVPVDRADAQLRARWDQFIAGLPPTPGRKRNIEFAYDNIKAKGATAPLQQALVGDRRRALLVLFGATVLLLLIACANVTSLLLSYGAGRSRELAVRSVLGATRARVVRQLVAESVLLSLTGAMAGVALAPLALRILRALMPASMTGLAHAHVDVRVLTFAAVLGALTGIVFGLWPAIGATRTAHTAAIKGGGGHGASATGTRRLQHALVCAELALTVMLLIGAGLMLRSFERLMDTDSGMRAEGIATLELSLPRALASQERIARVDRILDALRNTPGVTSAAAVNDLPLRADGGGAFWIDVPATPHTEPTGSFVRYLVASEDYFTTMGIALRRGRVFRVSDDNSSQPVAVVSESTAERFWPGMDPIGRTLHFGGDTTPITVIGLVADVLEAGLEKPREAQMYLPLRRQGAVNLAVVARGSLESPRLLRALTDAVRAVDATQAVYNVRTMDAVIGASVSSRRANTTLIAVFGGLALFVSVLGVYAVTSYAVSQRSRELGIRAALGASRNDLLRHAGVSMTWVAIVGVSVGGALAWALARVMANLLFGVEPHDVQTFAAAPALLVLAVAVATLIPARRAMRVNPVEVMRAE